MVNYGLIGRRLGHSFSACYFTQKFEESKSDERYDLYPLSQVEELIPLLENQRSLIGLNVTVPFKKSVIPLLSNLTLTTEAKAIGAVNTIRVHRNKDGEIVGYAAHNTDAEGFRESLKNILAGRNDVGSALVLGATGGAAAAVKYVLENDFGMSVTGVCRKRSDNTLRFEEVTPEIIKENLLIVNCTPLGMWPDVDSFPEIPYKALTSAHIGFDLVYYPAETAFLKRLKEAGATVSNGLEMLFLQADASYRFWQKGESMDM